MEIIKLIGILIIIIIPTYIGVIYAKSFEYRVKDLQEIRNALNIFKAKIKYTYKPVPEVFLEISKEVKDNIADVFKDASELMKNKIASEAWENALKDNEKNLNITKEDINVLFNLGKMLGNTDLEGQISIIDLTCNMLEKQIEDAMEVKNKNSKLYKTLGAGIGLTIAIILI